MVRGLSRTEIIERCAERLERDAANEFAAALAEVARIARFRLETLLEGEPGDSPGRATVR